MANEEPMEAADTFKKKKKKKKEISAFRHSVLNCIYLTFLVPFHFKNCYFL